MTAVGIDLGGTKIAAGVVDAEGSVLKRAQVASPADDPEAMLQAIADLVASLDAREVAGVGIGAAGIVDHSTGHYLYGPNVGLRDIPMTERLSASLGRRVVLDNDANVAAWAEHRFGCGRGTRHFLTVTVGTGIGGGIVIDGRPYRGARGGAAEIGHMLVDPMGPLCGCGKRGCWEQLASGRAMERMGREAVVAGQHSVMQDLCGGDATALRGPMVTQAARAGDTVAGAILVEVARWLGWGLASLVNILEPERIAIAGGLVDEWDLLGEPAVDAMRDRVEAAEYRPAPEVVPAQLRADSGIVGAALLVLDESLA